MSRIYIPANKPEDWRKLLAKPRKHWKRGYSAKTLAYCWQEYNDFPKSVRKVFRNCGIELFKNIKLLVAFPEYPVYLPPSNRNPSQNDIFILAKSNGQLVSIAVEGKVAESFDKPVSKWLDDRVNGSTGKDERLLFLLRKLQLTTEEVPNIRYQLLHRTASALIEAKKFNAENALMLVHSFSKSDEWIEGFEDYRNFLALYGLKDVQPDSILFAKTIDGINLYFGYVKGEKKYLDI